MHVLGVQQQDAERDFFFAELGKFNQKYDVQITRFVSSEEALCFQTLTVSGASFASRSRPAARLTWRIRVCADLRSWAATSWTCMRYLLRSSSTRWVVRALPGPPPMVE